VIHPWDIRNGKMFLIVSESNMEKVMTYSYTKDLEHRLARQTNALVKRVREKYRPWGIHQYCMIPYYSDRSRYDVTIKPPETVPVLGSNDENKRSPTTDEPTPKENERRLIELMENRKKLEDGLTIKEIAREIFGYKFEHKYRGKRQWAWRCVHIIPEINGYLTTPIINRMYKMVDSINEHIEERKKSVEKPWKEREAMIKEIDPWYENNEEKAKVLAHELRRRQRRKKK
jgi:hypothetical protein